MKHNWVVIVIASTLGSIVLLLTGLGLAYGYILYDHNINKTEYSFELLKSKMTVDEFLRSTDPDTFIRIVQDAGLKAKLEGNKCQLVAQNIDWHKDASR